MGNTYGYQYGYPAEMQAAESVAGFMLVFMVVFYLLMLAVLAVTYVLESLSMYKIAKRRGIHNPWLAWVPVGNMWMLGSISDQYQYVAKGRIRNRRKILLGLTIAMLAGLAVMYIAFFAGVFAAAAEGGALAGASFAIYILTMLVIAVLSIIATVYQYIATYDLYVSCEPDNSVLYLVLSIVFSITMPIFFFICRNKDGGMPPRKPAEPVLQVTEPVIEVQETPVTETAEEPVAETAEQEQTEE